jgi:hypothetical protein
MKSIERIYKYIDYKNIKAVPFEKKIGLSNGYLGKQLKRNADLGESILTKIIENCPEINPEWLLTGEGEMLKEKTTTAENLKNENNMNSLETLELLKENNALLKENNELFKQNVELANRIKLLEDELRNSGKDQAIEEAM